MDTNRMLVHLHIGLDKTGSTAIQNHIWLNRQWYADRGMFVPNTGFSRLGHQELFKDLFPDNIDRLTKELEAAKSFGFEDFFFSWEGIHTLPQDILEQINGLFPGYDFKIHVFLREQSEILQSGLLQQIKIGTNNMALEEASNNEPFLSHPNRDYRHILRVFANLFGQDSLSVQVYDKTLLPDGNVIKGLLLAMGLEADESFVLKKQASNISLDVPSAMVANEIDRDQNLTETERKGIIDQLLNDIAKQGSHEKYFLSEQAVDFVRQHFQQSNREVVQAYLGSDWPHPDLFPYQQQTYTGASAADITTIVSEKRQKLAKLQPYITWRGKLLSGSELGQLAQPRHGWEEANESGVSPSQSSAHIYFRPFWRLLERQHEGLRLVIECSFPKSEPPPRLTINGCEHGALHPGSNELVVPLEELDDFYCLDLDFCTSQKPDNAERKSFTIHSVHFELLPDQV